jgi:hypothetical protein
MAQSTDTSKVQIDGVHSRAICEEVGYRLRQSLKNAHAESAPHLNQLVKRMRLQEVGGAPTLARSSDDRHGSRDRTSTTLRQRFL